jgi:2-polyprenyl-6-hydroxyphenyl methylase/3-demethylubiquinone-9 3-methyltransferase
MAEDTNMVADYGWQDGETLDSQAYLMAPVLAQLQKLQAGTVLDLGCGNGAVSHHLHRMGYRVFGCDADPGGIAIAREGDSGAEFAQVSLYDAPESLEKRSFDAVISTEVIEHLFEPAALPRFAAAVLKPGGHLIVTTPYHGYLKNLLLCLAGKWDSHHTALWDGGHIKFWSRRTLTALLEANGFEVVAFAGAGRFYGVWKSMVITARLREGHR